MKKLIMSVLAMAALASCEKATENVLPEPTPENNLVPIELRAKVLGMEAVTKAELTAFNGEQIGIYALKDATEANKTFPWVATPYYNNPTGVTITESTISFPADNKPYYPIDDTEVQFFAYHPYAAGPSITGGVAPEISYTITGAEDILYAKTTNPTKLSTKDQVPALAFDHKLAKITFKVVADASFDAGYSVTKIDLTGCNNKLKLNLGTGVVSVAEVSTATINAYTDATGTELTTTVTANAFGIAMIKPAQAYGLSVTVKHKTTNKEKVFTITANSTLEAPAAGKVQTVTLTFKGTEIKPTASISGWGTDDPNSNIGQDVQ